MELPPAAETLTKATRIATLYSMIISFQHKGLELFFKNGSKAKIQPHHESRLRLQLFALNRAAKPVDLNAPGWKLHSLSGDLKGFWSITVNGNWRLIFRFTGSDVELVDYLDYH